MLSHLANKINHYLKILIYGLNPSQQYTCYLFTIFSRLAHVAILLDCNSVNILTHCHSLLISSLINLCVYIGICLRLLLQFLPFYPSISIIAQIRYHKPTTTNRQPINLEIILNISL